MKEKIKRLLKDRKKLIGVIGVALLIIVIAIICAFIMSKKQDKNVLKLKQDQFIVEYGDSISLDPRVYLKEDINNDIISNTEVEILGDKKYEAGKEYFGDDAVFRCAAICCRLVCAAMGGITGKAVWRAG